MRRLPSAAGFLSQWQSITRSKYQMKRWCIVKCHAVPPILRSSDGIQSDKFNVEATPDAMLRSAGKARFPPLRMANKNSLSHWLSTSSLLSLPRRTTWRAIVWLLAQRGMTPAPAVENSYRADDFSLIRRVLSETDMLLLQDEAYQILSCARATNKVAGDVAEVGVYRGGSARLICEARGNRALHLFDTFEGLPNTDRLDARFGAKQYVASFEKVQHYLAAFPNVNIYKGLFPATSDPIADKRFSFVHLDVDLYQPTRDSLEFFYSRVNAGGMILIHDYLWAEGVRKAVQEFFASRPETILELAGAYCGVVKL
jgi:O-methyltransferase